MPTIEAEVRTERASRYLVQFCTHASAMGGTAGHRPRLHPRAMLAHRAVRAHAEWTDSHGVVTFTPGGRCTIDAGADTLTIRVEAADEESLGRMRDIITRDLDRFSRRDPLTIDWYRR